MRMRSGNTRYTIEALVLTALSIAVFGPWGCSRPPVAPDSAQVEGTFELPNGVIAYPGTKQSETEVATGDGFATIPIHEDPLEKEEARVGTFTDTLDAGGGIVNLDLEGETSYFSVPLGALFGATTITIEIYRDQNVVEDRVTEFHFGPEGLVFNSPALLSYKTELKDGETLDLYWWNPISRQWVVSASAVVIGGYATFPVLHFSDYKTTERISLGGQRGSN